MQFYRILPITISLVLGLFASTSSAGMASLFPAKGGIFLVLRLVFPLKILDREQWLPALRKTHWIQAESHI
jgi:hypothetical protein